MEGHIRLRHSHLHVALRVSIPSDGVELAPLHWCLRRSHKPSKTLKQPQTHFWGLPWKTETHLNLSLYYSTDLFVLWVSPTPNGSRLQSSLRQDSDHHSQHTILVAGSMGGGIFLLLFFLSFPLYIFQRDIFILLCCYITIANNNQNGYIPAFHCNQIFSKINPTYMYLQTKIIHCCFSLSHPKGSINKNLGYPFLQGWVEQPQRWSPNLYLNDITWSMAHLTKVSLIILQFSHCFVHSRAFLKCVDPNILYIETIFSEVRKAARIYVN